jgi:hypothetical protein
VGAQGRKDEKTVVSRVADVLQRHYEMLVRAFTYFSCGGSSDTFHMGLNQFTAFLEDCKVGSSLYLQSHPATINGVPQHASSHVAVNQFAAFHEDCKLGCYVL